MKNLFTLLFLFSIFLVNAQTVQTITPQLKLGTMVQGSASDSILVRGADKIVKYVKKSSLAGSPALLQPAVVDSYIGSRLFPLPIYNGFEVNKSINGAVGYRSINNDDSGNGAIAGFTAKGSGTSYVNSTAMSHFGASYFVPYFAGNGAVLSNKKLLLGTIGGSDLELFTGTSTSNSSAKLIVKNNGQLILPIKPTVDNSGLDLLGRLSDGKVVTVEKSSLTPDLQQLLNAGNSSYLNDDTIFHARFMGTDKQLHIFSSGIQYLNADGAFSYSGLSGFINVSNNSKLAELGFAQGLKLQTTSGLASPSGLSTATLRADLMTDDRVFQFSDAAGILPIFSTDNTAPTSATDLGSKGEIKYNNSYIFMCVETNVWIRVPRDLTWN